MWIWKVAAQLSHLNSKKSMERSTSTTSSTIVLVLVLEVVLVLEY